MSRPHYVLRGRYARYNTTRSAGENEPWAEKSFSRFVTGQYLSGEAIQPTPPQPFASAEQHARIGCGRRASGVLPTGRKERAYSPHLTRETLLRVERNRWTCRVGAALPYYLKMLESRRYETANETKTTEPHLTYSFQQQDHCRHGYREKDSHRGRDQSGEGLSKRTVEALRHGGYWQGLSE